VYGYADDKLVAMVQQNKSWISDIKKIPAGVETQFSALLEEKARA